MKRGNDSKETHVLEEMADKGRVIWRRFNGIYKIGFD